MVKQLGIVGFGAMGSEIAALAACTGISVMAYDRDAEAVDNGKKRLARVLKLLTRDQKFFAADEIKDDEGREEVLSRIERVPELDGMAGCDFVIEAAPEVIAIKHDVLKTLEAACGEGTIFASNTSSISITEIAVGISKPEQVVGMHFFNPPSAMGLVEIIPGLATSEETLERATELASAMGKKPILIKETPGFVVNRVLLAMVNEAIRLAEDGIASIEDIDDAMRLGAGFPLGPFKLADLVGLDVLEHACDTIYNELGDSKFRPPFMLRQLVRAGRLGRKTRHGFYKY